MRMSSLAMSLGLLLAGTGLAPRSAAAQDWWVHLDLERARVRLAGGTLARHRQPHRRVVAPRRSAAPTVVVALVAPPPPPISDECVRVEVMQALARMVDDGAPHLPAMRATVPLLCGPLDADIDRWPTGDRLSSLTGTWFYPGGEVAITSTGAWHYPDGVRAHGTTGEWYYPNGEAARRRDGSWHGPDGTRLGRIDDPYADHPLFVTAVLEQLWHAGASGLAWASR